MADEGVEPHRPKTMKEPLPLRVGNALWRGASVRLFRGV